MNKILVLFDSVTGNVQQMAELVGEGAAAVVLQSRPHSQHMVESDDDLKRRRQNMGQSRRIDIKRGP